MDGSRSHETADADVFHHLASSIVRRNKKMQRFDDISCYFKSDNGGVENGAQWKHRYKVLNKPIIYATLLQYNNFSEAG